jgi:signal transduction histidine kinase
MAARLVKINEHLPHSSSPLPSSFAAQVETMSGKNHKSPEMRNPFSRFGKNKALQAAAKITLLYFAISVVWIIFSDRVLLHFVHDPVLLTRLQSYKGLIFVCASSIVMFVVIWKVVDQLRLADLKRMEAQHRAHRRLRKAMLARDAASRQMKAVFRHSSDGIVVISEDQTVTMINLQAERQFGADRFEHSSGLKERVLDRILPEAKSLFTGSEQILTFTFEMPTANTRNTLLLSAAATRLFSSRGVPLGAVVVLRDISRNRQYEILKSRLIATTAHELRTPLTAVLGFAEFLAENPDLNEGERAEYLKTIYEKASVLSRIVDDLLDLNRLEIGESLSSIGESCDLGGLIQTITDYYSITHKDWNFRLILPTQRLSARCDSVRVGQAIENLLDNAVKFSDPGTAIELRLRESKGFFEVCVSDKGSGMPPEVVSHVFDPFYKADTSDTGKTGLGLGLAMAKNIIEGHGGKIWIESAPGEGTTVCFSLPRISVRSQEQEVYQSG